MKIKSNRTYSGFSFRPVNYEEVLTELKNLDVSKTTQLEGIPTKIVKENLNIFATFLTNDINKCIRKGEFPDKLKTADITPAFKRGDKHDKSNYRPVSILPILSKVYEKCLYKQIENYMENILSNVQCGFRKGFNTQQCLIGMIEKAKSIMDKGGHFSALLTDPSKAFDCLPHDLLIAKLDAYGFKNDALYLIFNYLNNRKQRVKINSSISSFQNIISGVTQGSLLGPLLFNIFLTDIFLFCPTEIASYTDDNTPYATGVCLEKTLQKVEIASNTLFKWFYNNYMVANADKCHLLTSTSEEVSVKIENEIIKNSLQEKLLGIVVDNRLTFEPHVKNLCKKAGQKLHALARIASYMDISKKRSIMNAFILSQFSYCPLIWMFHNRKLNHRINN